MLLAACPSAASAADAGPARETVAVMKTTQGPVTLRFFPDKAPEHVKNFLSHAKSGLYKKTFFHRVMKDFMIQGGDPNTKDDDPDNDGQGGHSYKGKSSTLKSEFNDTPHLRGVLSMAREEGPDTAGSQFFIMVKDNSGLDGKYTVFGRVIKGMDAVDKIVEQPGEPIPGAGGVNPKEHQYIEDITVEEWTVDDVYISEAREFGSANCLRQPMAVLETSQGEIGLTFFGDKAPEHVRNFLQHCRSGYYSGTCFHRVAPDSLVQGGDPNTKNQDPADDGKGGHSWKGKDTFLKDEFSDQKHVRGVVTMARGEGPDSAGSQFLILLADKPELDGKSSAFGRVIFGIEAAEAISRQPGDELPASGGIRPKSMPAISGTRVEYLTPKKMEGAAYEAEKRRAIEALKQQKGKQLVAVLETTQGKIYIRFYPDKAPVHVYNFMEHIKSGLYEGTYFHRVMKDFMIQGGDPNTKDEDPANDGQGGFSYKGKGTYLKAEFNDIDHARGVLSTARSESPDSAGSQFFIMVKDNSGLNWKYTAFGRVISGMQVVDKIVSQPGTDIPGAGGVNPKVKQLIKKASIEVWADSKVSQYERKRE